AASCCPAGSATTDGRSPLGCSPSVPSTPTRALVRSTWLIPRVGRGRESFGCRLPIRIVEYGTAADCCPGHCHGVGRGNPRDTTTSQPFNRARTIGRGEGLQGRDGSVP